MAPTMRMGGSGRYGRYGLEGRKFLIFSSFESQKAHFYPNIWCEAWDSWCEAWARRARPENPPLTYKGSIPKPSTKSDNNSLRQHVRSLKIDTWPNFQPCWIDKSWQILHREPASTTAAEPALGIGSPECSGAPRMIQIALRAEILT